MELKLLAAGMIFAAVAGQLQAMSYQGEMPRGDILQVESAPADQGHSAAIRLSGVLVRESDG